MRIKVIAGCLKALVPQLDLAFSITRSKLILVVWVKGYVPNFYIRVHILHSGALLQALVPQEDLDLPLLLW